MMIGIDAGYFMGLTDKEAKQIMKILTSAGKRIGYKVGYAGKP
jgi:hypothetical protein